MQIVEFVYRGRTPSEAAAGMTATYHVRLGEDVTTLGETRPFYGEPITPEAAAAKGFSLSAIAADINQQLLAENAALKANTTRLEAENAALRERANGGLK